VYDLVNTLADTCVKQHPNRTTGHQGMPTDDFKSSKDMTNANCCYQMLHKQPAKIKNKHHVQLSDGNILLYYYAYCHVAHKVHVQLNAM